VPKVPFLGNAVAIDFVQGMYDFSDFCPNPCNESGDSLHALHTQHFFALLRPWSRNESVDSLHRLGHFPDFCPDPCNESGDSLHALHTQHIFALLRPGSCNESVDSLHHMGHFSDFCPNPCNESGDSLHRMGHFSDFYPNPCNESGDSLHRMGHFSDFCPDPCNESGDSLHHMGHFPDFCPNPCNESEDSSRASRTHRFFVEFCSIQRDESVNSSRDECRFPGFCHFQRDESPAMASVPRATPTEFAIRAWAGVISSMQWGRAVAVRADIVLAARWRARRPRSQANGTFGGSLSPSVARVGEVGRPSPSGFTAPPVYGTLKTCRHSSIQGARAFSLVDPALSFPGQPDVNPRLHIRHDVDLDPVGLVTVRGNAQYVVSIRDLFELVLAALVRLGDQLLEAWPWRDRGQFDGRAGGGFCGRLMHNEPVHPAAPGLSMARAR
jgi:hypothetical protein